MPIKVRGADGKEVEHFNQEEVDKMIKEREDAKEEEFKGKLTKVQEDAIEQYKKDNPDQKDKIDEMQKSLDDANEKLKKLEEGGGDDDDEDDMPDGQKNRLKKTIEELKGKIEDVTKTSEEKIKKLEETMQETTDNLKKKYLDNLAEGDEDRRKKLELEFDQYMPDKTSEEDIKARAEKAYTLVEGSAPKPGLLDGATNASARGEGNQAPQPGDNKEVTENQKEIGKHIGVNAKDWEEYGDKDVVAEATGGQGQVD